MAAIVAQLLEQKNLERVCRLCLTDATEVGDLLPIFPIRGGKISNASAITNRIQQCTSLLIDPSMKGPRWICELCHVRLEDWYAFREQCLGSDEYLRFNMRQWMDNEPANKTVPEGQPEPSTIIVQDDGRDSESHSAAPPATEPTSGSGSSLAHRRKSVFEWTVPDARGGQKVIVELLGDEETAKGTSGPTECTRTNNTLANGGHHPAIETPPMEDGSIVNQPFPVPPPADETVLAASSSPGLDWAEEFRARVNSQMHIQPGAPRPYECKICHSRFKRRNNLRRHIRAYHADEIIVGESPAEEFYALRPATLAQQQQQHHHQQQQQQRLHLQNNESMEPKAIADDNASDMNSKSSPLQPVYQCTVCPRSFKMPAHLAVHRKAHLQKDLRAKEAAMDHQRQQQQQPRHEAQMMIPPVRTFGRKSDIEPCAIIQLSDDDDDDDDDENVDASQVSAVAAAGGGPEGHNGIFATTNGASNGYQDDEQADDGFDEDEGSLKEASLEPSSLAIVELGVDDGQTEVIIPPDVDPWKMKKPDKQRSTLPASSSSSSPPPPPAAPPMVQRSRPGPLSFKRRHTTGGDETSEQPHVPLQGTPGMPQSMVGPPNSKRSATLTAALLHAGPVPYRCHFCQETFPQEELLRLHLKTHGNDAPAPFRCGWCRKGFRYRQNYMIHVEKQTCRSAQSTGTVAMTASSAVTNGGSSSGGGGGAAVGLTSTTVPRLVAKKRAW